MPAIAVGRPRLVCDLGVEETFLAHHVSKDFFEATERLGFKRPPQAQVSAVRPKPFAELVEVELFCPNDLHAGHDVMSLHGDAMNATQLTILLASEHDRACQKEASRDTEHD